MPQKYADRVAVIIVVIVLALLAIFWPSVRHPARVFDAEAGFFKKPERTAPTSPRRT